jgi:PBSX family phage terminase large subunit
MLKQILSPIQKKSIVESNARLNFWEGPVRSGKSYSCFWRWIDFILNGPKGPLIMCGRTEPTIKRNIIRPLQDLIGDDLVYMSGKGEVHLWGRVIDVVGANDERAEAKIRGSEYVGALLDEVTILPENFVKMLFSRLSLPDAKLFGSTNPDSPYHWLKTGYLDRQGELNIKVFSFSIEDNPSLTEEYKNDLKKEYQGLWYQRYIEGRWVLAEGAVYDFFDENVHTINYPPGNATYYICGIDYGTSNPTVFSLIGYNPSVYPNMWLEKEYFYDSKAKNRQKTDSDYCNDLVSFIAGYNVKAIYIDPSALSFKVELRRAGVANVLDATNDVLPGIRFQGQLIANGTYKVMKSCTNAIKEYSTYLWDERASKRGVDQPIKQNDHCCDAQRYALYSHFFNRINSTMTEKDADAMEAAYGRKIY